MDIQRILDTINAEMIEATDRGAVARYIPELADVDPSQFGMAVATADGQYFSTGDAETPFSIQSISKVFSLALGLGRLGEKLWERVGREPSGLPFNSIVLLEKEGGVPRNPFINSGALVVTDAILLGRQPKEILGEVLRFVRAAAEDDDIHINESVAQSEMRHGDRNMALAHFMAAQGNFFNKPELTCRTYFHQCAIEMNCRQLAMTGRFLMGGDGGLNMISPRSVRRINALMLTCGHYDGSGDFAFRVGLPGKSGVGGGILVVVPNRASIAVWSPGLNAQGNSQLGTLAVERFAQATGWSIFG